MKTIELDGGWWPPGEGEPGEEWGYEQTQLRLVFEDGEAVDVLQVTPDGDRALASIPVLPLLALIALSYAAGDTDALERLQETVEDKS